MKGSVEMSRVEFVLPTQTPRHIYANTLEQ